MRSELDAGTDAKVAKFHKRGLEVLGLAILECVEVWPSYGRSGTGHVAFLSASNGANTGAAAGTLGEFAHHHVSYSQRTVAVAMELSLGNILQPGTVAQHPRGVQGNGLAVASPRDWGLALGVHQLGR